MVLLLPGRQPLGDGRAGAARSRLRGLPTWPAGSTAWAEAGLPLEPAGGYVAESGEAAAVLEERRRSTQA